MGSRSELENPVLHPLLFLYQVLQSIIAKLLAPNPPPSDRRLGRPKIAVIGAGITGVTAAAHCVGHGFDVVIFENGGRDQVGGIWSVRLLFVWTRVRIQCLVMAADTHQKVNDTSGLQIHSLMYRFHPSVQWERGYPDRQQIVGQVQQLWKRYGLDTRTRFNFKVEKAYQDEQKRWIINDPSQGRFDGLIAAVGTCGDPKMPTLPGMDDFNGEIYHSSQLTGCVVISPSIPQTSSLAKIPC